MSLLDKIAASVTGDSREEKEPVQLYRRNGLFFRNIPSKGRGVFCKEDIKAGEVIEVAPLLIFNEGQTPLISQTLLGDYVFGADASPISPALAEQLQLEDPSRATCLPMGVTSFLNHLVDPNAEKHWIGDEFSCYVVLKAKKDIPAGTEICHNYGIAWLALHKK